MLFEPAVPYYFGVRSPMLYTINGALGRGAQGFVAEIARQPALDLFGRHGFAPGVVLDPVAADAAEAEIMAFGVGAVHSINNRRLSFMRPLFLGPFTAPCPQGSCWRAQCAVLT